MTDFSEEFRKYLLETKKSSSNTVESYMRDVNQFLSYCTEHGKNVSAADCSVLNTYLEYLSAMGKSEATKSRTIASLRCFYRFLSARGLSSGNPVDGIKMHKTEKKLPLRPVADGVRHAPAGKMLSQAHDKGRRLRVDGYAMRGTEHEGRLALRLAGSPVHKPESSSVGNSP